MDLEGAELLVGDLIPGEHPIIYDREDPPIGLGSCSSCKRQLAIHLT